MALLSIFASNPEAVAQFGIDQIATMAGDGNLRDGSTCSGELREYLSQIPTGKIEAYVEQCLANTLNRGGLLLQDLVNELGRRLDYEVINGRYQGVAGGIGFDGLWRSPEGHSIVAEVKTTDAYRISLDTLAGYRSKLLAAGQLTPNASILIIVGRQDTGELEAQIRGSKHAWDVRVISIEALIKLALLKEGSEAAETGLKIRSLLMPVEYTRLDRMVDVMFAAATDVEQVPGAEEAPTMDAAVVPGVLDLEQPLAKSGFQFTDSRLLQDKREGIVASLGRREGVPLIKKSRALYWSAQRDVRVACSISKRYSYGSIYWYAFHPAWQSFLKDVDRSFFVLGCMDLDQAFAIPLKTLVPLLPFFHTTTKDGNTYWHIHLNEPDSGLELLVPRGGSNLRLAPFAISAV